MKDRDDRDFSNSDSDSDSSEDDEAALNPKFDQEFYKTLASLKQKDPKIYDNNVKFFEEDMEENKPKKSKALTVKDYEQKLLLENGGVYDEEDDTKDIRSQSPTYHEEQNMLKNEFKNALQDSEDEDGEGWGGIFKKREKTKEDQVSGWQTSFGEQRSWRR